MELTNLARAHAQFPELTARVLEADPAGYDEWLFRYCGDLVSPEAATRYVVYHTDLLRLAGVDPNGRVVLDAGCGFGMMLLLYGTLGAEVLHGVDIHEGMITTALSFLPLLPDEIRSRFDLRQGDVTKLPVDDASIDVLTSMEAISHYLSVGDFVVEAARVLKPGGTLIISDGNNGDNPLIRRKTQEIWERFELGPNHSSIEGHEVGVCYRDARRELIAREFPEYGPSEVDRLADGTFAMTNDQVIAAVTAYRETGNAPRSHYRPGVVPVGPDGAVMERLFSPRGLARALSRHGFDARAYGYWGGAAGNPAVRTANTILQRLSAVTMPAARAFTVVARRR